MRITWINPLLNAFEAGSQRHGSTQIRVTGTVCCTQFDTTAPARDTHGISTVVIAVAGPYGRPSKARHAAFENEPFVAIDGWRNYSADCW